MNWYPTVISRRGQNREVFRSARCHAKASAATLRTWLNQLLDSTHLVKGQTLASGKQCKSESDELDEREKLPDGIDRRRSRCIRKLSRPCDLELSHLSKYVPALTGRFFKMRRLWAGKKGNVALFLDSLRKSFDSIRICSQTSTRLGSFLRAVSVLGR